MPFTEIRNLATLGNPRDAKFRLAREVVKTYHSEKAAEAAQERWDRVFSRKDLPTTEVVDLRIEEVYEQFHIQTLGGIAMIYVVAKVTRSNSEATRLIRDGAVELNGQVVKDPQKKISFKSGDILRIGKHRFFKVKTTSKKRGVNWSG